MAGLILSAAPVSEIALTAATVRTVLRVKAAAQQRCKLLEWGISFDGTSATAEPVQVELLRQTTDGTFTALTLVKDVDFGETIQATAGHTATSTEPTTGDILRVIEVHPTSGVHFIVPDLYPVWIPGGGRLGIRCTAPANVNCRPYMRFEE